MLNNIVSQISNILYSYALIIILVLGGIYFTVRTKGIQFRSLPDQFRLLNEKPKDKKGVSPFQALMVSTASRVGTGNIIGVSVAICVGGYGSVFWMWVIALIGAASAFVESTLAQIYKKKGENGCYGGPANYIEAALHSRTLAIIFSVLLILTYGVGFNMLASYNLQSTFAAYSFYDAKYTPWIIGGLLAILVAVCLIGSAKKLVKVTEILVPFMGVAYIAVSLIVVALNITSIPTIFARIFTEAFDLGAIFGGFSGSCVMYGIKRGLFSNEAGIGSAPNASASAEVSHPVKQGLVQVLSVFLDTLVICTATAFMCLCSGIEPTSALQGAPYVQLAIRTTLGSFGPIFITAAMLLFGFTTLLGNLYYVDKGITYIIGHEPSKKTQTVFHIIESAIVLLGAVLSASLLWDIADIFMGGMALINIPVICILGKYSFRALKDYETQKKAGKDPVFHAKDISLPHDVDYWD